MDKMGGMFDDWNQIFLFYDSIEAKDVREAAKNSALSNAHFLSVLSVLA